MGEGAEEMYREVHVHIWRASTEAVAYGCKEVAAAEDSEEESDEESEASVDEEQPEGKPTDGEQPAAPVPAAQHLHEHSCGEHLTEAERAAERAAPDAIARAPEQSATEASAAEQQRQGLKRQRLGNASDGQNKGGDRATHRRSARKGKGKGRHGGNGSTTAVAHYQLPGEEAEEMFMRLSKAYSYGPTCAVSSAQRG